MSLEAAISENTQAINRLIDFLSAQVSVASNGTSGGQQGVLPVETSPSIEAGEAAVNQEPVQETVAAVEPASVVEKVETVETILVDDVVALKKEAGICLTKVTQKVRKEKAYEVLQSLGYSKWPEVKIEDYPKIIEICGAIL